MSKISVGSMDARIEILSQSFGNTNPDGFGSVDEYTPTDKIWAAVKYLSDREKFSAASTQHEISIRFVIRKRELGMNDRIRFDGDDYNIIGKKPVQDQTHLLEITAGIIR